MADQKEIIRSMVNNLIYGKTEAAAADMHAVLVQKAAALQTPTKPAPQTPASKTE